MAWDIKEEPPRYEQHGKISIIVLLTQPLQWLQGADVQQGPPSWLKLRKVITTVIILSSVAMIAA